MGISLLDLPAEIRLEIYSLVFKEGKVVLEAGNYVGPTYILPKHAVSMNATSRSSQLLQTCKTVLIEARPILYEQTVFHVSTSTFCSAFPIAMTNGSALAPHARRVVWQLQCDLMKKFYFDEFAFSQSEVGNLESLELWCRAENWRDSYCGDLCDRKAFTEGREQMIEYAKRLVALADSEGHRTMLTEDRSFLGRGEVRVRISRAGVALASEAIANRSGGHHSLIGFDMLLAQHHSFPYPASSLNLKAPRLAESATLDVAVSLLDRSTSATCWLDEGNSDSEEPEKRRKARWCEEGSSIVGGPVDECIRNLTVRRDTRAEKRSPRTH